MRAIFGLFILVLFVSLTACGSGSSGGADLEPSDINAAHDVLLSEATGYFAAAGGTGGQGGRVYYVTNLNDSGPGSMRDALESTEPLIVLFENGVNGTINITSGDINVRSNKTIWGRHRDGSAADIFIHPINRDSPFNIEGANKNIIIANLKGDAPGPNNAAPDFVSVSDSGSIVWVHHVTVIGDGTSDMDGFVDVYGDNVTISWNRVEDWSNVHLLRSDSTVTLHHNLYRNSAGRHPKADTASAHAYNNWLDNWGYDGMRVTNGGEIVAENNIFTPGAGTTDKRAIQGVWGGSGNVLENGAFVDPTSPVFTPPYAYTLDPVVTAAEQQALKDELEAKAGWQGTFD